MEEGNFLRSRVFDCGLYGLGYVGIDLIGINWSSTIPFLGCFWYSKPEDMTHRLDFLRTSAFFWRSINVSCLRLLIIANALFGPV